jgi:hypothetical protein
MVPKLIDDTKSCLAKCLVGEFDFMMDYMDYEDSKDFDFEEIDSELKDDKKDDKETSSIKLQSSVESSELEKEKEVMAAQLSYETYYCDCPSCTQAVMSQNADGHSCGNRMNWMMETKGMSQLDACKFVADEFPSICGSCHADRCRSVPTPTPPTGTCGSGNRGDGVCADGTCCSQYGWCGTSAEHCSGGGGGSPPSPSTSVRTGAMTDQDRAWLKEHNERRYH